MEIIHLVDFGPISPQLLGVRAFSLLSVDCKLIIPVTASGGGAVRDIESWGLRLWAGDERIREKVFGHGYWVPQEDGTVIQIL